MSRKPPTLRARRAATSRRSTTRWQHLYNSRRWRQASTAFRADNPLCAACRVAGKVVASAHTDHIVPHNGDLALFWDHANWEALCASCHSSKSRSDQTGRPARRKGCDANGLPTDPAHHWNTPGKPDRGPA